MLPGTTSQDLGDVSSRLGSAGESLCGSGQASPTLWTSVSPVVFTIPSSSVALKHKGLPSSEEAVGHEQKLLEAILGDEVRTVQSPALKTLIPGWGLSCCALETRGW